MTSRRPRVGISRCLLGDDVRYDGTHRRDDDLIAAFAPHVEWVPVCPEVEVGMGTPREPIQLVASATGVPSAGTAVRLRGVDSGEDWTDRMDGYARARAEALRAQQLSGFILKARSPSCGVRDVAIRDTTEPGRGLFAQALVDAMPDLPMADEDDLRDPQAREAFLEAVRTYRKP